MSATTQFCRRRSCERGRQGYRGCLGPNLVDSSNVVGGVTSFGLNGTCGGTGGVFRVDRGWSLDWLNGTFGRYLG